MASIKALQDSAVYEVNRFLGLNLDEVGELILGKGESPSMCNFRITENYKLTKREGWEVLASTQAVGLPVRGLWFGKVGALSERLFYVANGSLFSLLLNSDSPTLIGSVGGDSENAFLFSWANVLYVLNGKGYYKYDGATFSAVEGYRPKLKIGVLPNGTGGSVFEEANILTGKKQMQFISDGLATLYTLCESGLSSVDFVLINGVNTTNFTSDLTNGKVTFPAFIASGAVVTVGWTKNTLTRSNITDNLYGMFYGGKNDVALFLWGNGNYGYRRYWSALGNPEYFPELSFSDIGGKKEAITDIVRQYDRQIIFTESEIYYSYIEASDPDNISFPVFALNSDAGNKAFGMVRILNNNPVFLNNGVFELTSSAVRDEKNVKNMGARVQSALNDTDISEAITVDFQENGEYFIAFNDKALIYNYRNNTWYTFDNIPASRFLSVNGELYFGSKNGEICAFKKNLRNDYITLNKQKRAIHAYWQMPLFDFGREFVYKYVRKLYLSLKPQDKTYLRFKYRTDDGEENEFAEVFYSLFSFENLDFADFTFQTSYNPKPFLERIDAKKFAYFKLILTSDKEDYTATVLSLIIPASFGSLVG